MFALDATADNLFAVGGFSQSSGFEFNHIARFDGTNWFSLGNGLPNSGYSVAVHGREAFAGHHTGVSRWTGNDWEPVGEGFSGPVTSLALHKTNLFASGLFDFVGTNFVKGIAQWDESGWHALGAGVDRPINTLAIWRGQLLAGGEFTRAGEVEAAALALWDGNAWSPVPGLQEGAIIYDLAQSADGNLYVAGNFRTATSPEIAHFARWDGTSWFPLGSGVSAPVLELAVDGPDVYLAGYFTGAGGKANNQFARWHIPGPFIDPNARAAEAVPAGGELTYGIDLANRGDSPSNGGTLLVPLPEEVEFISATAGGAQSGGAVQWSIDALGTNETVELLLTVRVLAQGGAVALEDYQFTDLEGRRFTGRPVHTTITAPPLASLSAIEPLLDAVFTNRANVLLSLEVTPDEGRPVYLYSGPQLLATILPPYTHVLADQPAGLHNYTVVTLDQFGRSTSQEIRFSVLRPPNDDFADRISLHGFSDVGTGISHDATAEPNEPNHDRFWKKNSLWWTWQAPANGRVRVSTIGTEFTHILAFYSGNTLSNLLSLGYVRGADLKGIIDVESGVDYQFVVDGGYPFAGGLVRLELDFHPNPSVSILSPDTPITAPGSFPVEITAFDPAENPVEASLLLDSFVIGTNLTSSNLSFIVPHIAGGIFTLNAQARGTLGNSGTSAPVVIDIPISNDDFENAVLITSRAFTNFGSTVGATSGAVSQLNSVWWKWISPVTGTATVAVTTFEYANLSVFEGTSLQDLILIGGPVQDFGYDEVTFEAESGKSYHIMVDAHRFASSSATGKFKLTGHIDAAEQIPQLRIDLSSGGALIRISEPTDYILEKTSYLDERANWLEAELPDEAAQIEVPISPADPSGFFRLRKP